MFNMVKLSHGKTFTFQSSRHFPGKFNRGDQKSIAVSDESPRLYKDSQGNTFYSRRATHFSPALGEESIAAFESHQQKKKKKKKKLLKGKIPNSKGRK